VQAALARFAPTVGDQGERDVSPLRWLKHFAAAWLLDAPRYGWVLRFPVEARRFGRSWVDLRNRGQCLVRRPGQCGVSFVDRWSTDLFYCRARPRVGQLLLSRAVTDWPVIFREAPAKSTDGPLISFLIGHRGTARLEHLQATLASIAGQAEVPVECVVVEQDTTLAVAAALPGWVRHIHAPPPDAEMPYSRSWAFNVGARHARGEILVCHDNDLCVPSRYAVELAGLFRRGFEAARLQRFIFYLSESHTREVFDRHHFRPDHAPVEVVQNTNGGTVAVRRDVYFAVGGHDEGFLGWGGEDNEIFERLQTRRFHDCSYLPFLHLFHAPQPGKAARSPNASYFEERERIDARTRIEELIRRGFGLPSGPTRPAAQIPVATSAP
jgi:hypothetical protein